MARNTFYKQPLRWGILSTARIKRAVIPPIKSSTRHVLSAIASRDLENAKAEAKEWEIHNSTVVMKLCSKTLR
jgi:predicted dehydrogenase